MERLPIDASIETLKTALRAHPGAVLLAPPGSGKTTRVPLALLREPWLGGRNILMLEPRRLAAKMSAEYMARLLGEPVGRRVGYRMRMDSCVGPQTRIEVVTDGVLARMIQRDPALAGTGLVIFDEFHERHLQADLGLALCLEIQGALNTGLKLLAMSATLETGPVAGLLGGVPVVVCEGRQFPVETRFAGRRSDLPLERDIIAAVLAAAADEGGSILVFLQIYASRLGATPFQLGLLTAAPAVVNLLFTFPAGSLTRKWSTAGAVCWSALLMRSFYFLLILLPVLFPAGTQIWLIIPCD